MLLHKHITVLKTAIPSRVVYRKCISHQIPAHHIEKKSIEGGQEAVDILESLVHEILPHYNYTDDVQINLFYLK